MSHLSESDRLGSPGLALGIAFVNTVEFRASDHSTEFLNSYGDLVKWGVRKGLLKEADAAGLLDRAAEHPDEASRVFRRVVELREAVYRIILSVEKGTEPAPGDLGLLNDNLSRAMMNSLIFKTPQGFIWEVSGNRDSLDWILNPVIRSIAELLVSDELGRVKRCADSECGWIFLDKSKNRSRKWCNMSDCGNRAKARRYYERKKKEK